jgi:hypothetical protein
MEEHNEAFIAWHHSIRKESGVQFSLIHVDEHSDLCPPRFYSPLPNKASSMDAVARFVFDQMTNYEFIVPLALEGMIREIIWIHREEDPEVVAYLAGTNSSANSWYFFQPLKRKDMLLARIRQMRSNFALVDFAQRKTSAVIRPRWPVLLDIDLDYFSCRNQADDVRRIELSESEVKSYCSDRYHYLRVELGARAKVLKDNGRYYLVLREYPDATPAPLIASDTQISERIAALQCFLRSNAIQPRIITICRSAFSAYSHFEQVDHIQELLFEALRSIYTLQVCQVQELYRWP